MKPALEYVHPLEQCIVQLKKPNGKAFRVRTRIPNEVSLDDILEVIPLRPYPVLPPPPAKNAKKETKIAYEESKRNILGAWSTSQYLVVKELMLAAQKEKFPAKRTDVVEEYNYDKDKIYNIYHYTGIEYVPIHELRGWIESHHADMPHYDFDTLEREIHEQWRAHATQYLESVNALKRRCEEILEGSSPLKRARVELL